MRISCVTVSLSLTEARPESRRVHAFWLFHPTSRYSSMLFSLRPHKPTNFFKSFAEFIFNPISFSHVIVTIPDASFAELASYSSQVESPVVEFFFIKISTIASWISIYQECPIAYDFIQWTHSVKNSSAAWRHLPSSPYVDATTALESIHIFVHTRQIETSDGITSNITINRLEECLP